MSSDKVTAMPGQVVNRQLKQVNQQVVEALKDMLSRAEAGELQAVVVAFAGYDSEPIHGRAVAGNYMAEAGSLVLQQQAAIQEITTRLVVGNG